MRTRYRFDGQRMVDRDGLPMVGHNELASSPEQIKCPMVMRDTPEYESPIDGRMITSRSWRREDLARNGCIEADPPKRRKGIKNERFAAKRGLAMDGDIAKDGRAAERHNRALHDGKLVYRKENYPK